MEHSNSKKPVRALVVLCIASALLVGALAVSASAESLPGPNLDPSRVPWTSLLFQAKHFFVTVTVEVQLRSFPAAEVMPTFIDCPRGFPIKPTKSKIDLVTVNTTIIPLLGSAVTLKNEVWFDPETAGALQRIRLRRGEDDFKKMYRFAADGVYRLRREPADKREVSLSPEKWTDVKESFYPYDLDQFGCRSVSEASIIPYIITAVGLSQDSQPIDLCDFHKRLLHQVQIAPRGEEKRAVSYTEKGEQSETRKQGIIDLLKISLESRALSTIVGEEEDFSFLGLKGDIEIHVDTRFGIPVQVSGNIPTFGRVDLELYEVKLK